MQARGEHRYRSAIGVVGEIGDELIVERQRRPLVGVVRIEGLDDLFRTIIDLAVADQNAEATDREEIAVIPRDRIDGAGKADLVVRATPGRAADRGAERGASGGGVAGGEASVDVGECGNFGLAVVPAPATEYSDVVGERLLEIQVVAVFGSGLPGQEDGIVGIEARTDQVEIDGLAIAAGKISVGPDSHAKLSRAGEQGIAG